MRTASKEGARGSHIDRTLARLLSPIAKVEPGEARAALALGVSAFLILFVYYLLKPLRESWIVPGGAETKTYVAGAQAVLLVAVARGYAALARRVGRAPLVAGVTRFFASNLLVFWALDALCVPLGVAFYGWLGVFDLVLVAQLWAVASDLWTPSQGRRLFAVVGAGAALGAVSGALSARAVMGALGAPALVLPLAAAVLLVLPLLSRVARVGAAPPLAAAHDARGALAAVLADPYLRVIAALTIALNFASTLGEYVLDRSVLDAAGRAVASGAAPSVAAFVGGFRADYYAAVNAGVLVLSLFAVAPVLRHGGERTGLASLPAIALVGALLIALVPELAVIAVVRVVEGAVAHSLHGTARQTLFLVAGPTGKWAGKALIDTALWRAGDVLAALTVAAMLALGAELRIAVLAHAAVAATWLVLVLRAARMQRERAAGVRVEEAVGDIGAAEPAE